eukprot:TRINITY_DN3597_c0_g3_i1.p1 TRINITY_DN3597_c0_g3~~TRINITY_DN3597_c0_g3_i1.p1  ORF type:complete len:413 (+),score=125.59 TRINITY_DN3597_c0_g3_i1:89-1240(+)
MGADDKQQPEPSTAEEKKEEKEKEKDKEQSFNPNADLWQNIAQAGSSSTHETQEINVLVIGSKGSGKSTLIQRFIKRDDSSAPRPTTALEYSHGRKEEGKKTQIVHFWEIGGGPELHSLMDVVLTPENIHTAVVAIVCDLSEPSTVWDTVLGCVRRLWKRVEEVFSKMRSKQSKTPQRMVDRQRKKLSASETCAADIEEMRLLGMNILIVGSKYDKFQENPLVQVTAKTMRLLAHLHGAHLIWTTNKDEKEVKKWQLLLSNIVFGASFPEKYINMDYSSGPLFVYAGRDSFESVGKPDLLQRTPEGWQSCGDDLLDQWKKPHDHAFPPTAAAATQARGDDKAFGQMLAEEFAEPEIDAVRRQKDAELDAQRKEARKAHKGAHG